MYRCTKWRANVMASSRRRNRNLDCGIDDMQRYYCEIQKQGVISCRGKLVINAKSGLWFRRILNMCTNGKQNCSAAIRV